MSRRLLIHPGLHKTGTTTLQDTLRNNRDMLAPYVETILIRDPTQFLLSGACQQFSVGRNKANKAIIREEALDLFGALDRDDPRPVLLSNETLGGRSIGYKTVQSFAALPIATAIIIDAWHAVMGEGASAEVYISTRRTGWLRSCWWQRLKSERFRMPYETFERRYAKAADHTAFIAQCRDVLGDTPVHRCDVEDAGHPARPVLDLLGLPHFFEALSLGENRNVSLGGDAHERLLDLNRSDLKGPAFWAAKRAIMGVEKGTEEE